MRAVVQRVKQAEVKVERRTVGVIGPGVLVFLGVGEADTEKDSAQLAKKIAHLRIFSDEKGLMNLSLTDISGEILVVSQFTLWGDCRKGRRPSFTRAASPERANALYEHFIGVLMGMDIRVATGEFQTLMDVNLINDGPVTLLLDSSKSF